MERKERKFFTADRRVLTGYRWSFVAGGLAMASDHRAGPPLIAAGLGSLLHGTPSDTQGRTDVQSRGSGRSRVPRISGRSRDRELVERKMVALGLPLRQGSWRRNVARTPPPLQIYSISYIQMMIHKILVFLCGVFALVDHARAGVCLNPNLLNPLSFGFHAGPVASLATVLSCLQDPLFSRISARLVPDHATDPDYPVQPGKRHERHHLLRLPE